MYIIILFILLVASLTGLLIQDKKIKELKNYIDNIPKEIPNIDIDADPFGQNQLKQKNRRGIIIGNWTETDKITKDETIYKTYTEVEEIENLGTLSRIKIIKITGANINVRKVAEDQMPEIIEQSKIEFF